MENEISVNDVFLQILDATNAMRAKIVQLSTENEKLKKEIAEKTEKQA
jgi:hypothetical protein